MKPPGHWAGRLGHLRKRMFQQKDCEELGLKTELRRCLTTPQLTLLGVGNTIGVGIYVMLGVMAKENAGPSVIFSFMAAIFVTMMNALVFAEFSTFVPQTGACYSYIYKVLGEFMAFLVGWVMLIASALASSVGARAWSGMLDAFFNNTIQVKTTEILGKVQLGLPFAENLDILAFVFQILVVVIISCNIFCASIINSILSIVTSSVLVFVFVAGLLYGEVSNFTNVNHGGFFPFGLAGVIKGASLAIYATSGFEVVSLSAEESKDPAKAVPRAIILELLIVGLVYIGAAVGMLFLIPYWLIDLRAPLPSAFEYSGVIWGKYIVTFGPLFGITNLQMLGLYSFSRILYKMAKDGLFFQCFLKVNKQTGVPLNSVILVGVVTSVSALLFDLSYIVKVTVLMMLLNYMLVASALIKLRITESYKMRTAGKSAEKAQSDAPLKLVYNCYDQEVVVSEYETCESSGSPENENLAEDGFMAGGKSSGGVHESPDKYRDVRKLPRSDIKLADNPDSGNCSLATEHGRENVMIASEQSKTTSGESGVTYISASEDEGDHSLVLLETDKPKATSDKKEDQKEQTTSNSDNHQDVPYTSIRFQIATALSSLVPGVMSINTVLVFHWICCVGISFQLNFAWQDLAVGKPWAVLSLVLLSALLVVFSLILWVQCDSLPSSGFQTSLMPLVPTLSLLSSSALLLSAGELVGFVEVATLVLAGAVIYTIMVLVSYQPQSTGFAAEDSEQRRALVGGSGDDADDEVDSDDEI